MASSRRFALMLMRDPVLQELNQRMVAESGVAAAAVAERNVIKQIGNSLVPRHVSGSMNPFYWKLLNIELAESVSA